MSKIRLTKIRAAERTEATVSTKRLLDLSTFYLTAGIVGVSKEAEVLARNALPDFVANIEQYVSGVFQVHGFKGVARVWGIAQGYPPGSTKQILAFSRMLVGLYDVLEKKGLLRSTFSSTEDATAAIKLSKLAENLDDEQAQLALIGSVRLRGLNSRTRKWTRAALTEAGVAAEGFDDLVEEVATATALGQAAAVMGNRLGLGDPDAEANRQAALERIDTLAAGSTAPEQVHAAAVAGAAAAMGRGPLKTKTGQELFAGNTQQEDAMLAKGKVIVAASAGSGKSRVLAAKVVYHVKEQGIPAKQIIATSFTRKSGAELKDRIKKYSGDKDILRAEADDGFGTTHSIAKKLLDRFVPGRPRKNTIGSKSNGSDFTSGELLRIALQQINLPGGNGKTPDPNETFFPSVETEAPEEAKPLSWPQAVFQALKWLNSDRAEALRRIPRYGIDPSRNWDAVDSAKGIFAKIVERRAGPEDMTPKQMQRVREVFRHAGLNVNMDDMTPPTAIEGAAKRDYSVYGGDSPKSANQWFNLDAEKNRRYAGVEVSERDIGSAISRWKGQMVTPGAAWAVAVDEKEEMLAAGYGAYEWLKTNDPVYAPAEDGDDHLIGFCRTLIENASVRSRIQARFKIVLVDEAQDLSPCQHLMFGLITGAYDPAKRALREDGKMASDTYAMIGDDRQAIYAFRGADPDVFIDNSDKRGGTFETKFLSTNYRSGRKIVEAANRLIANNTRQIPMVCEVPPDRYDGAIRFADHTSWDTAAKDITSRINEGVRDGTNSYQDYGIGVRTNSEGMQLAMAMLEAGIPFKSNKYKPLSNFLVKGTLNWMLLSQVPDDKSKMLNPLVIECSQTPKIGIGKATLEDALKEKAGGDYYNFLSQGGWQQIYKGGSRGRDYVLPFVETMQRVREVDAGASTLDVLQLVLKEVPGLLDLVVKSTGDEEGDTDDSTVTTTSGEDAGPINYGVISPLFRLAERFDTPAKFFAYIREMGAMSKSIEFDDKVEADDKPNEINAVTIDTVHGWKGLEVKHMIVPMSSSTFPSWRSPIEDERRLAYVAVTRGEESVTVLSVREPYPGPGGAMVTPPPSQFVQELSCADADGKVQGSAESEWDTLPWHEVLT